MENPFASLHSEIIEVKSLLIAMQQNQSPPQEKLHSVKTLAEFADISELTVRNKINKGIIKAVSIDGMIRIPESQFLAGLDEVKSLKYKR